MTMSWQLQGLLKCVLTVAAWYFAVCIAQQYTERTSTEYVKTRDSEALNHPAHLARNIPWDNRIDELTRDFADDNWVYQENFVPADVIAKMRDEVTPLRKLVYRNGGLALQKQGGGISYYQLLDNCPQIYQLYHSPQLLQWARTVTGLPDLEISPLSDPHSAAVYWYDAQHDHVHWHYDTSFFDGVRYTMLLPLVEESSMKLEARIVRPPLDPRKTSPRDVPRDPARPINHTVSMQTQPGAVAFFLGDDIQHRVTNMNHDGERRIVLTMEFVTSRVIQPFWYFIYINANAGGYFGFSFDLKLCWMALVIAVFTIVSYLLLLVEAAVSSSSKRSSKKRKVQ